MDKDLLWWNYVSGAVRYLNDSLSAASKYRVLLIEERHFMEQYFNQLQDKLLQVDSSLHMEVSFADEWSGGQELGETLMSRYASQMDYHPLDGTRTEFIAKKNLLAGRVLVIREVENCQEWLDFAIEYAKHSQIRNGLLILTFSGLSPLTIPRKWVAVQKWDDYFSNYDMQLFASYCMADRPHLSSMERTYITQIASRLAGTDPKLCSLLAAEVLTSDKITADTEAFVQRLADYGENSTMRSAGEIELVLWEAQIQTVFPIVEQTRRRFIELYNEDLGSILPRVDEFGNKLEEPKDMELRHMWYYYFKPMGFRNAEDKHAFKLMYDARNDLAHLKLLNKNSLTNIFSLEKSRTDFAR